MPLNPKLEHLKITWLTDIPYEIRAKVYKTLFVDGFQVHCMSLRDHRYCQQTFHVSNTSVTHHLVEHFPRDRASQCQNVSNCKAFTQDQNYPPKPSFLVTLLQLSRAVRADVEQSIVYLLATERQFFRPAPCINDPIWWMFSDIRLVDPTLQHPRPFTTLSCTEKTSSFTDWRITLIQGFARSSVTFYTANCRFSPLSLPPMHHRVHLYDFTPQIYGRRSYGCGVGTRSVKKREAEAPNQIFIVDHVLPRLPGCRIGPASLMKSIVGIEIALQSQWMRRCDFLDETDRALCSLTESGQKHDKLRAKVQCLDREIVVSRVSTAIEASSTMQSETSDNDWHSSSGQAGRESWFRHGHI